MASSGFREVRSSSSRLSANRFLDKQQPQSETVADTISSLIFSRDIANFLILDWSWNASPPEVLNHEEILCGDLNTWPPFID
jgi:hypothetical protein